MKNYIQEGHHLLGEDCEGDRDGGEEIQHQSRSPHRSLSHRLKSLLISPCALLIYSTIFNIVFLALFIRQKQLPCHFEDGRSKWGTKYGPMVSSEDEIDRHWRALDVSPGLVRLPDDFARAHGLPLSMRFPWDESQGMYYLGAFHQIHCLKEVQFWMSDTRKGKVPETDYHHVQHCLDTLLQDAICHADDLPWYQLPGGDERKAYAKYQTRKCKNFDQLLKWTKQYDACFQYDNVTDPFGRPTKDMDEHYRYCPEGSQWTSTMRQYFDEKYAEQGERIVWDAQAIT